MKKVGDTLQGGVPVLMQDTCWVRMSMGQVLQKVTDIMPSELFDVGLLLYVSENLVYALQNGANVRSHSWMSNDGMLQRP